MFFKIFTLVDYNNGNAGDMLINLDHYNGQRVIGFETEGKILHQQDTVIVNVSTTDPNIYTVQAMLIIAPNDIDVQIIPETISKGDTARVILKKRENGVLNNFAPDKLFNVEIVEGSEYGWILDSLSNDTLTTWSNIPQGFKIIAKDSTDIDSTRIKIKVTTEDEIILPAARLTKEKLNKEIQNKSLSKDDKEGGIMPNWIGDPGGTVLIEGFGDLVVGKNCSNLVNCQDKLAPDYAKVKIYPATYYQKLEQCGGSVGNTIQTGGLAIYPWVSSATKQEISTQACWRSLDKKVHFKFVLTDNETNQNSIVLNPPTTLEICETNISNAGWILIKDTTQLLNILRNYPSQIPIIKKDIDSALSRYNKYKFLDEIMAHELEHKSDYQKVIDELK